MVEGVGFTRGAPLVQNQGKGFCLEGDRGGLRWKVKVQVERGMVDSR